MKETILSTQDIFDGRIVHLKLHTVELPNGEQTIREVIQHQGAAAIVAINSEREILLVKQFRIGAGIETYEIPAGLLEPDEVPVATATRELQEETGYVSDNWHKLATLTHFPTRANNRVHIYLALSAYVKTEQALDPNEDIIV